MRPPSPRASRRLGVAAELAERYGAHLVGVHVREPFDSPAFVDGMMPMDALIASYQEMADTDLATAAAAFEKSVKGLHLPTEWRVQDGYVVDELTVQARYADLLVVGGLPALSEELLFRGALIPAVYPDWCVCAACACRDVCPAAVCARARPLPLPPCPCSLLPPCPGPPAPGAPG